MEKKLGGEKQKVGKPFNLILMVPGELELCREDVVIAGRPPYWCLSDNEQLLQAFDVPLPRDRQDGSKAHF